MCEWLRSAGLVDLGEIQCHGLTSALSAKPMAELKDWWVLGGEASSYVSWVGAGWVGVVRMAARGTELTKLWCRSRAPL